MRVAPEEQMDLVRDERQRRMQPPQPPLLPVAGDAAGEDRHPETREREALDQLQIAAGQEPGREHIDLVLRECEDRCANPLAGQSGTSMGPISDSLVAALVSSRGCVGGSDYSRGRRRSASKTLDNRIQRRACDQAMAPV